MSKYNKFISAIVGGVVGIIMVWLGLGDATGVDPSYMPFVDAIIAMIMSSLGTLVGPANTTNVSNARSGG